MIMMTMIIIKSPGIGYQCFENAIMFMLPTETVQGSYWSEGGTLLINAFTNYTAYCNSDRDESIKLWEKKKACIQKIRTGSPNS